MQHLSRRSVLTALGLAAGGVAAGDAVYAAAESSSVPSSQLQYDAAKTGYTDAAAPSTNLRPAWRFQRTGAGWTGYASAPAIADDALYFVSNTSGRDGFDPDDPPVIVQAVNADGTEKWRTETDVAQCSPAIADGLVFVWGRGGTLVALDVATGEQQWSLGDTGSQYESSPTVADGTVYLPHPARDGEFAGLNAADGSEQWSFRPVLPGSPMSMTSAAVADGVAYFAVGTDAGVGELYGVDATSGERQWGAGFPREGRYTGNIATPTVAGGRVFFATNNALFAFSLDGTEQWRTTIDGFTPRYFTEQSPAAVDGTVYFPDGDGLAAFDAASGERKWTFEPSQVTVSSSPSVAGDTVYVGTERAGVYALDVASGDPVGQYRSTPDVQVIVPPVAVDGRVYVGEFSEVDDAAPALVALESGEASAASAEPDPAFDAPDEVLRGMSASFENRSDSFGDFTAVAGGATFRWDFDGDGETDVRTDDVTESAEYTFEESGQQTVTLTVENDYGWTASVGKTVSVSENTYEGPVARIETDPADAEDRTFESGATVALDASASTAGTSDIVSYEWTVNGHDERSGVATTVELDGVCGDWRVSLTVTDEQGVTDEATSVLHVGD